MLQQVGGDSRLAIATLGPCNHLAASRNEPVALDSHTKIWNKAPGQHCWVSYMSARSQTSQQISTGALLIYQTAGRTISWYMPKENPLLTGA